MLCVLTFVFFRRFGICFVLLLRIATGRVESQVVAHASRVAGERAAGASADSGHGYATTTTATGIRVRRLRQR